MTWHLFYATGLRILSRIAVENFRSTANSGLFTRKLLHWIKAYFRFLLIASLTAAMVNVSVADS